MSTNLEDLILRNIAASRPTAGVPGRLFYDTTNNKLQRDTGASWEDCEPAVLANPMDTAGDIIVGGTSGAPGKLAKGSDGNVLTISPSTHLPVWSATSATSNYLCNLLYTNTLASTGTFDTNPTDLSGYDHLLLRALLRTDRAASAYDNAKLYFNNDSTAGNYYHISHNYGSGSTHVVAVANTAVIFTCIGSTGLANSFSTAEAFIPYYAGGTLKIVRFHSESYVAAAEGYDEDGSMKWANTAAITRIQVVPETGTNFEVGSKLEIFGLKAA